MAIADSFDIDHVETVLQAAARDGEPMSYAGILLVLGHRFTRPRMRALCRILDTIDQRAIAAGRPELAVLVVRESDRLPGQGWWVGRSDYRGDWAGDEARHHVNRLQQKAFAYWADQAVAMTNRTLGRKAGNFARFQQ